MVMRDYRVELETFSGPLDLLLYLVRRHEIDLHDIPIAKLTEQYLSYLKKWEQVDIDVAGEFLVMAATLLEIKSQMLLPLTDAGGEGEDAAESAQTLDPRYELIQQLLEYKRFKDAAMDLEQCRAQWDSRFARQPATSPSDAGENAEELELDLDDAHLLDLAEAYTRIMESIGQRPSRHEVLADDTPLALHAEDIIDRLRRDGPITLQRMFAGRAQRTEWVGLFLAMLELVREMNIRVYQDRITDQIKLELREPPTPEDKARELMEPNWHDEKTGQVQYEWPSDQIREKVERRARLRADRLASRDFSGADDEIIDVDGEE